MLCVFLKVCVCSLNIVPSVCTSPCLSLSPHTLRSCSFVTHLYKPKVTRTTWALSPCDKIPSCKDGSRPTFRKKEQF